jgi:hypothetical protein
MNYSIEQFSFTITEYGQELTAHSHQTLYWLNRNGYLNNEDTEMLLGRMIVTPVANRPSLGKRLLSRFFNKDTEENSYVFPITLIDDVINHTGGGETVDKPNLKVIK